jgi:precorrin-6B methylase 2
MELWLTNLILILILVIVTLGFLVSLFLFFVLLPILRGAPFVPIQKERVEKAIELLELKPGQKIVDLGSGDGRILIFCAKKGTKAIGFEINPFLVWKANSNIKKAGLENLAQAQWRNFWWQDLSSFDVVFVYGISHIMRGLERKLQKELKPGAKVVSFIFKFPNWQPEIEENGIYIYSKEY